MAEHQRNPSFGSDSDGEQVESESQADSRSEAQSNSPTTVPKISDQLQEIYKQLGICGRLKGNIMAPSFFPSDSFFGFSKGRVSKSKDNILCVSRDTFCSFTLLNKNSEGSYVTIEIFSLETQNKVGSFQGDADGTGVVQIKNNIAEQVRWMWPKECKSNTLYGIKVSLMNEEDKVIECCDVQPLFIMPHTTIKLHNPSVVPLFVMPHITANLHNQSANSDSILQKAKQILSEASKWQAQKNPLNDLALLGICLVASGRSCHPNLDEYLRRCDFASDHDAVEALTTTIAHIQLLEVPFSNSSDEGPNPEDLQKIEFLLWRL